MNRMNMVNLRINWTFSTGAVRNARRMNQRQNARVAFCEALRRKTAPTGPG